MKSGSALFIPEGFFHEVRSSPGGWLLISQRELLNSLLNPVCIFFMLLLAVWGGIKMHAMCCVGTIAVNMWYRGDRARLSEDLPAFQQVRGMIFMGGVWWQTNIHLTYSLRR